MNGWKTLMKRQAGLRKAQLLIELATHSVGTPQALDAYKLHLEQLFEEFRSSYSPTGKNRKGSH